MDQHHITIERKKYLPLPSTSPTLKIGLIRFQTTVGSKLLYSASIFMKTITVILFLVFVHHIYYPDGVVEGFTSTIEKSRIAARHQHMFRSKPRVSTPLHQLLATQLISPQRRKPLVNPLFSAATSDGSAPNNDKEWVITAIPTNHTINPPQSNSKVKAVTFNLIKAIAGSGVLALPSGLAAVSDYRSSLIPAIILMSVLGGVSAYTFAMYGRLVHASQAKSLGELWEKKKDKRSAWFVSVASLTFCFGACLSYSILLGDVSSSMAHTIGWSGVWTTRHFWTILLTCVVLYPLCNLRSLIALAPLSLAGVAAVLITTMFIAWRSPALNPTSPYAAAGGQLLKTLSTQQLPKFSTINKGLLNPSSLILLGMSASAYLGHFTAPNFYHSVIRENNNEGEVSSNTTGNVFGGNFDHSPTLQDDNSLALKDYFKVTFGGFLSATIINCLIMAFGFLTFGGNSMGVILNNYSTFDSGATICRFLTAVSVIGGYPLLISACRTEFLELWHLKSGKIGASRQLEKRITTILLMLLTIASMIISNAGFVIGLSGAVMGSAMVYIFPCLLYLSYTGKMVQPTKKMIRLERMLCRVLIVFGIAAALAGGIVSVISNFFPQRLAA